MLFVHGWALDARIWEPQMRALAPRHRLIRFDRRGFGHASAPPDPSREADDIRSIMDALDIEQAVIVAMSQGARSALAFAVESPQRVQGLVLAGAPFPYDPPASVFPEKLPVDDMRVCLRNGDMDGLRGLWRSSDLLDIAAADACSVALLDQIISDYEGRDLLIIQPALSVSPEAIAAIGCSALIATGVLDNEWRQRAADTLVEMMPDARRLLIPEAGHLCSLSQAALFNRHLEEFVAAI